MDLNLEEVLDNLTEDEKTAVICRIKNIEDSDIVGLYYEIKDKGTFDDCDYDCLSEYSVSDIEWGYGEKFGGYVIYLDDLYESTYEKLDKKYQELIDKARSYDIKEFRICEETLEYYGWGKYV